VANKFEEYLDIVGKKFVKYYMLWSLVKFGLGLLWLGVAFLVALIGINFVLSNIPVPKV